MNVFDPRQFPYPPDRRYTTEPATVDELLEHEHAIQMDRMIVDFSPD